MKLTKIYFDAFKSLLNKELEINHDCIGFVGTNESGKSNVLAAINVLNNRKLIRADTPKMAKANNPLLRFLFILTETEKKEIETIIKDWCQKNTLTTQKSIDYSNLQICYNITFNKEQNIEERFFTLDGLKLEPLHLILKFDKITDLYKIKDKDLFIPLSKAIIIKESNINFNNKHQEVYNKLDSINNLILEIEKKLEEAKVEGTNLSERLKENESQSPTVGGLLRIGINQDIEKIKLTIVEKSKEIEHLKEEREAILSQIKDFNIKKLTDEAKHSIENGEQEINKIKAEITSLQNQVDELQMIDPPDAENIDGINKTIANLNIRLRETDEKRNKSPKLLEELTEPLEEKYTNELTELNQHLGTLIKPILIGFLPTVVFWEHGPNYILQSETLFAELLNKKDLNEISRPLVNVFRIGLNIKTLDELKAKIREIQTDISERSRYQETLNEKINEYIGKVWADYDQRLQISLEKDQIVIQIFDPNNSRASFYTMEERSQGCKTFLSFLLTISVEAEHEVIQNTILLLDEPETHLHPSGVRYMLKQLIKIAKKNNQVFYATHSIFLIDREKFDRHIILKKVKESTTINPSNVGRIGYFMQEEVLYRTLDLNLDKDFSSSTHFNFVFEGDGDVNLFANFYEKVLTNANRPFPIKSTSFHQGGKCSDIQKYFNNRAIPLGTKWIFILDSDSPGNELKKFIEGKYRDYLDKDVFVFQYTNADKKLDIIELEDILSKEFIIESFKETALQLGLEILQKELDNINDKDNFIIYNETIISKIIKADKPEIFKAKFKEVLNTRIRKSGEPIKDDESFSKIFPEYYKWVSDVIAKLTPVPITTSTPTAKEISTAKELPTAIPIPMSSIKLKRLTQDKRLIIREIPPPKR